MITNLCAVTIILVGLSGNSLAADIDVVLPTDSVAAFNEVIAQAPLSTDSQLESANASVIANNTVFTPVHESGTIEFAASTYSVIEDNGTVNVTINRVGGSAGEITVEWRTLGVTADFTQDYGGFSWTPLTFAGGETSKVERIYIVSDTLIERDETFKVLLRDPTTSGNLAVRTNSVVTIVDDDTNSHAPSTAPSDHSWEDLLNEVVGYGRNTTGGQGGDVCWVDNLNDSGVGSLRNCAESSGPKWIRFNVSGTVRLNSAIHITSNKTIDGRDADITITTYGLKFWGVTNVILHNLKIEAIVNTGENVENRDAISLRSASNIWIDHVSVSNAQDELIEIGQASTDITVSWSRIFASNEATARNYGIILGFAYQQPEDVVMRVTMHHNYFFGLIERSPRMRYGKFHAFNNYFFDWKNYASWASQDSEYYSENNIYEAVGDLDAILTDAAGSDPNPGKARDEGSWLFGGAQVQDRNPQNVFEPSTIYSYTPETAGDTLRTRIQSEAGWQM